MTLANRVRRVAAILTVSAVMSAPALAQEISEAHLKAARDAVNAIRATDLYDGILPAAAAALKQTLIQKNPDLQEKITAIVDEKALVLAGRRADLEKEAALAYAKVFAEQDLAAIAAFYTSETGLKLLDNGPIVSREVSKAADIWQRGITRDLAVEVGEAIAASLPAPAPVEGAAQPEQAN